MNRFLNDQRAPSLDHHDDHHRHRVSSSPSYSDCASPPILLIGGRWRDLSNLCLQRSEVEHGGGGDAPLPQQPQEQRRKVLEHSFYPCCEDEFFSKSSRSLTVEDIFDQVPFVNSLGDVHYNHACDHNQQQQQQDSSSSSSQRHRSSSTDMGIDRFDEWIVEPIDLGKKRNSFLTSSQVEEEKNRDHDHHHRPSTTEFTVEETESSLQHYFLTSHSQEAASPSSLVLHSHRFAASSPPPPSLLVPPAEPMIYTRPPSPPQEDYYYDYDPHRYHPHDHDLHQQHHIHPHDHDLHQQHHIPRTSPTRSSSSSDWLNHQSYSYQDYYPQDEFPCNNNNNNNNHTRTQQHNQTLEIEVAPGEFWPLRGAEETLLAVERGQAQRVSCMSCGLALMCLPDCLLVVCPDCMCLSPATTENNPPTATTEEPDTSTAGGVGVRFLGEETAPTTTTTTTTDKDEEERPKHGVGLGLKVGVGGVFTG